MDPNQAMPPSAPVQNSAPQPAANPMPQGGAQPHHTNNDLYAQITAEDEEIVVVPKKKTTPVISAVTVFMKLTFWVDELRRSHERFFILLHTLWACFMGVLYLSGIIMLWLSVFSFMQLPVHLEKYLSERGIQYDSLEMADYSFSKVNIINLRDKDNTYTIPQVTIHSTFADFLQNRIRIVEANSLDINVLTNNKEKGSDFDLMIKLLQAFSDPKQTGLDLDVNVIRINNAVLNIQTSSRTIPVSFNLSGSYRTGNELVVKFSVNEDFLKMDGTMTITGPENDRTIKIMINDKTGFLTLPQRPTEELAGNVTLKVQNHKVQTIEMEAHLNYAYSLKTIRASLKNNGQDAFDGSMLFTVGNSSDGIHISSLSTDVTFNFQDLILTAERQLKTDKPLQVNLRRLVHKNTTIEGLNTTLKGNLLCSIDQGSCSYKLSENALLRMQSLKFDVKGHEVLFTKNPALILLPATEDNFKLQINSPYLKMETPFRQVKLSGTVGETEELQLDAEVVNLYMVLAQKQNDTHFKILVQNGNYMTFDLSMSSINMSIDDYFDETGKIHFDAYSVQTGSDLLKKPVSLDITNVGEQTDLKIQVLDTNLGLNARGRFDPFKFAFTGRFNIPVLDLQSLPFALAELSSVFPKNISDLSGKFAASGTLKVNGLSSVSGPLYTSMKDVSFKWDDVSVSGVNAVLAFSSLNPLVTGNNQKLFIQNIESFISISNLLIQFFIDSQSFRLAHAFGQIGGQDVIASSTLIPLKNSNTTFPIRTPKNFDLSKLNPYFNLPGIFLNGGEGLLNLPVHVTDDGISLGDLTIKMMDTVWQKAQASSPVVLPLFDSDDTNYNVRNGLLTLAPPNLLQVALNGWRVSNKQKVSFGPETVELSEPLLKQGNPQRVPSDIQKLQSKFGM